MKSTRLCLLSCFLILILAAVSWAQVDTWKGAYVGGYAGASISRASASLTTVFSPTGYFATTSIPAIAGVSPQHPESTGFTGGFEAGYNFQHDHIVYGVEADFGAMNHDETRRAQVAYPCCAPTAFIVSQRLHNGWLGTVRPRLGYAPGNILFFFTGGMAVTNLRYDGDLTDTFANAAENREIADNKLGWIVGGGVEYKASRHWSLKGEYLYAGFGDISATSNNLTAFSPPIAFPTNVFTHKADFQSHIMRFGLNWHF